MGKKVMFSMKLFKSRGEKKECYLIHRYGNKKERDRMIKVTR